MIGNEYWGGVGRGGGWGRQNWDVIGRMGVGGVRECFRCPILIFILKKIGFVPWPSIMLSQTLIYYWQEIFFTFTLTLDSEAILYSYHCIVCGINRTIERVVNFNVTWLSFVFVLILFVHNTRCGCCSIACLRFQVVEIKQVYCKMSPKNMNNYK